jgi:hypothetical protein
MLATHENLAVAMAHGYGMVSRRIPAVMAQVSVETANDDLRGLECGSRERRHPYRGQVTID